MRIQLSRVIELSITAEALSELLTCWAALASFTEKSASPGRWVFRRGSRWLAPWTFDVRQVPTEVTIVHLPNRGEVTVSLLCASIWQVALPHDRRRLEDDFNQLLAFLCSAPGQARDRIGEEIRQRWHGTPGAVTRGERDIREVGQ